MCNCLQFLVTWKTILTVKLLTESKDGLLKQLLTHAWILWNCECARAFSGFGFVTVLRKITPDIFAQACRGLKNSKLQNEIPNLLVIFSTFCTCEALNFLRAALKTWKWSITVWSNKKLKRGKAGKAGK